MKIRTIITQDAEVDDQNSLRHFLFYANEVDLQGIVQTSSKFHWRGLPGTKKRAKALEGELAFDNPEGLRFDRPHRWTGTDWMLRVMDDYAKDYPNLSKHAEGYPTPNDLRSITKVGNVDYMGEMETSTEGSELIRKAILDDDPRTLYIQVWGGCNTIARALLDIEAEYGASPDWDALHEKISRKVVLTACGEQDETYRTVIAEKWPQIAFVKTLQMMSYAYPWLSMPECESKDCLRSDFMQREILNKGSALASGYCTWLDGNVYEGEEAADQFGSNPNVTKEWFGARFGLPEPVQYDFLSEGDSPTFFLLLGWGLRSLEDFTYGGVSGRFVKLEDQFNSKGEPLNYWDVAKDQFADRDGNETLQESMWRYVADIQRDFAARVDWACTDCRECGEHPPKLKIMEGVDFALCPGQSVTVHAAASEGADISFRLYEDAGGVCDLLVNGNEAILTVPADAVPGEKIHIIVKAQLGGHHRLTRYQQIVICVL